jgi:hypothetical protein
MLDAHYLQVWFAENYVRALVSAAGRANRCIIRLWP